ncbi:uncharacterized protein CANTADRAFT_71036 [Suhomyces tanzawaensis NRRL Y-17324]|uniref:Nuclear polyadenylated RNA-binding protein NAB2 n=1 Tax=Suhomyces tanzawaensis NRRL Y-17324 TaxID=984487 RepID=A0A1E4SDK7_9ASCO|nr:uncharacterized protein CANTADRAFT_71036 [Suhomyces tanzawaensis NRRL Y-17324]ODV77597.1 hypothetical protein CANTADRAFT_71036 [Suhomyces tanzawaensis NRRL Y-17324]
MSVQFTPEDPIGLELKANLIQELKNRYNCFDDAQDIAEFIVILIVSNKSPGEILQEVKEIADIPIDIPFIETVFREIERIQSVHQGGQQGIPQPVPQQEQPVPVQAPAQVPAPAPMPVFDFTQPPPQFQFTQQSLEQAPNHGLPQIPTGPKGIQNRSRDYDSRAKQGRGGIGKAATNGRDRNGARKGLNPQIVSKVLADNNGSTNVTKFALKASKGRCQDFPYCNNKDCEFAHPTKNCFAYPNCTNPPGTCNYLHPEEDQELIAKLEKSKQEYKEKKKNEALLAQATCKFGLKCTKDTCPFAHPTPANGQAKIVTLDWCPSGKGCIDSNCGRAHPPPPSAKPVVHAGPNPEIALEQCKFGTQCTNYKCPRRHATSLVPCRAGAQCKRLDCTFAHPFNEVCRFGAKCLNKNCMYQHPDGRDLQSNTWSKDTTTSNRAFAVPQDQVMEQAVQD